MLSTSLRAWRGRSGGCRRLGRWLRRSWLGPRRRCSTATTRRLFCSRSLLGCISGCSLLRRCRSLLLTHYFRITTIKIFTNSTKMHRAGKHTNTYVDSRHAMRKYTSTSQSPWRRKDKKTSMEGSEQQQATSSEHYSGQTVRRHYGYWKTSRKT